MGGRFPPECLDELVRNTHTLGVFQDRLYVGTALFGIRRVGPEDGFTIPKGFDLIRVDPEDHWELIIGGPPIIPTQPTTGVRGEALSGEPSGFGNITNAYCWQLQEQNGRLYLGTFDWSDLIAPLVPEVTELLPEVTPIDIGNAYEAFATYVAYLFSTDPILSLIPIGSFLAGAPSTLLRLIGNTAGFDLWRSPNGVDWSPVTQNGLDNPNNYGDRKLFLSSEGDLYLGTANPFEGCEVWVRGAREG